MLDEDIQLRAFQSLKVDRNHIKLNLNQLSSLNKLESVKKNKSKSKIFKIFFFVCFYSRQLFVYVHFVVLVIMHHHLYQIVNLFMIMINYLLLHQHHLNNQ